MQELLPVLGEVVFTAAKDTRALLKNRLGMKLSEQRQAQPKGQLCYHDQLVQGAGRTKGAGLPSLHVSPRPRCLDSAPAEARQTGWARILLCSLSAFKFSEGCPAAFANATC